MMRAGAMAGVALLAAGCAGGGESSGVVALGPDVFVIENRGGILSGVVDRSLEQAAAFCASQDAQAEMLTTRVNPNTYQLAFRCSGRPGTVPVTTLAQMPGQPPTAARTRAVLEPGGGRRRRGLAVSAPEWAATPQDMPAFVTAPQPVQAAAQPVGGWAGGAGFAAQPPAGVPWATQQQAAAFGTAIPASVYTPPPMPMIAAAPEGSTRRMRGGRAARAQDRAYEGPVAAAPVAEPVAAVPMAVPMGVPLAPASRPLMPMAAPAQPVFAPQPAVSSPSPDQIPGLGVLPPQGQGPAMQAPMSQAPMSQAPVVQRQPIAAAAPPMVAAPPMAPVAGPIFQPSPNPLPQANAPLSAAPPASFWQVAR